MSEPSLTFDYQIEGGALLLDAPTYVRRRADDELYTALKAGRLCYVLNARQMGKSSLKVRTIQRLQEEDVACAAVDLQGIGTSVMEEQWYIGIVSRIVRSLRLHRKFNLNDWWKEQELLSYVQRFTYFIETVLLSAIAQPIVIFIDEVDLAGSLTFNTDDFFAALREIHDCRASNPDYRRLTFALFGVATPSDLIHNKHITPFNIGQAIDLTGFQLEEAQPLLPGLTVKSEHPEALLEAVLDWTGGQPFLTQKLCKLITSAESQPNSGAEAQWVAALVQAKIIDNWEAQDIPQHLKTIRDRLLIAGGKSTGRLLGLYQQLIEQGYLAAYDIPEQMELRLTGLVVKHNDQLQVYNPIYAAVFNQAWVESKLADLRPYDTKIKAWRKSGQTDQAYLLQGEALWQAQAWAKGKSLSDQDYQFLRASEDLERRGVDQKLKAQEEANQILMTARQKAESELADALKQRQKIRQNSLTIAGIAIVITIGATGFTAYQVRQSQVKLNVMDLKLSNGVAKELLNNGQVFESMLASLRIGQTIKRLPPDLLQDGIREQQMVTLGQALYRVRDRLTLTGHQDQIRSVAFSPDGKVIASACWDKTVKLWDAQTGQLIRTLTGHRDVVLGVSFSPDGSTIASSSGDKTIKLWNVQTGNLLYTLNGHLSDVTSVNFSPDGKTLASASRDQTIKLWDVRTKQLIRTFTGHQNTILSVGFSPDGRSLVSSSNDSTVKLWDVRSGKTLRTLTQPIGAFVSASFSPDGQTIAAGSEDRMVKLWNVQTGNVTQTLIGHTDQVLSVSFSPDGQMLASGSEDRTIKLWDVRSGTELQTLSGHVSGVRGVSFSPDGKTLVSGSWDKCLKIWDVQAGATLHTLPSADIPVHVASYSPDGKTLASGNQDGTITLWNLQTGNEIQTLEGHQAAVNSVSFSLDGQTLASAGDSTVKLWDTKTGKPIRTFTGHRDRIRSVSFSPDGKTIASGSSDKTVKLWDVQTGKPIRTFIAHEGAVDSVTFSPDGQTIASSSDDRTIRLWIVATGENTKTLGGHEAEVVSVRFSPDGKTIASTSRDNSLRLWDRQTGNNIFKSVQQNYVMTSVSFSPDGQTLATGNSDKTITLWDVATRRELESLTGHQESVTSVSFSPDGTTIASTSDDGTIKFWVWNFDKLMQLGCNWASTYLTINPKQQSVCKGYLTKH